MQAAYVIAGLHMLATPAMINVHACMLLQPKFQLQLPGSGWEYVQAAAGTPCGKYQLSCCCVESSEATTAGGLQ